MGRTMTCSNLTCRATLNVEGREPGTKVKCPKCGTVNEVQMDLGEGFDQLVGHNLAKIGGVESVLDFFNVFAILNNLNDLGVGAGSADPLGL